MEVVYSWTQAPSGQSIRSHAVLCEGDLLFEVVSVLDTSYPEQSWAEVAVVSEEGRRPLFRQQGLEYRLAEWWHEAPPQRRDPESVRHGALSAAVQLVVLVSGMLKR